MSIRQKEIRHETGCTELMQTMSDDDCCGCDDCVILDSCCNCWPCCVHEINEEVDEA